MSATIFEKNVKLEILISTMNRSSLSFLEPMFPHNDINDLNILIVNQTQNGNKLLSNIENIRVVNVFERGLSKSRNVALKNAMGDICLIADDDVEYLPNFETIILDSFSKLNKASAIRFKISTFSGEAYKVYPRISKKLTKKNDIESSSSIEIAFKRKDIITNNIRFNPLFGLGSYFESGEEYLFLKEFLKYDLQIYFEDVNIVKHTIERSTSDMGSDNFVKAKAALYYHDYAVLSYLVLPKFIIFLVRKGMIPYHSFVKKYNTGLLAIKTYKKLKDAKN